MNKFMLQLERSHIRWMIRRDVQFCLSIDRMAIPEAFQWSEEEFLNNLAKKDTIGVVIDTDNSEYPVCGFAVYQLKKNWIKLVRVAVHPDLQKIGYGTAIIHRLRSKLDQMKKASLIAVVPESNLGAQLFLQKTGMLCTDICKDEYRDYREDGYCFGIGGLSEEWKSL